MKIVYRISDNSHASDRIATKAECLHNFLRVWLQTDGGCHDDIVIQMDNIGRDTFSMIDGEVDKWGDAATRVTFDHVRAGSSEKSFRLAMESALWDSPDDAYVYLVEDDYMHLAGSRAVILEGLQRADYVSLYDHPDKYIQGNEAATQVYLTHSSHWKRIQSTTATFATTAGVLRRDAPIWTMCTDGKQGAAWDHVAFSTLTLQKYCTLISPIPGQATHTEKQWLSPTFGWSWVNL